MTFKKLKHDSHAKVWQIHMKDFFHSFLRESADGKASSKKDLNVCVVTEKKKNFEIRYKTG